MRRPLAVLALALALAGPALAVSAAAASAAPAAAPARIPPAPGRWATDEAGFLAARTVAALDSRLEAYERQTGHQLLVWIGRTLGENEVLEDWAVRTFEAWRVGRKGIDDGLVLFIFAEDRKIKIEVGYGLEDKVPDAYAFRVINNILAPGFRDGRPDEAVDQAVTALIGYIGGNENAAGGDERGDRNIRRISSPVKSVFGGIVILVLIILFITNPSLALWLLLNILGGGRGGGGGWGGGGGGGFGGGGGRSGGGGASGGW
jgi:uncharacterized protein